MYSTDLFTEPRICQNPDCRKEFRTQLSEYVGKARVRRRGAVARQIYCSHECSLKMKMERQELARKAKHHSEEVLND